MLLAHILESTVVIDIETVSQYAHFNEMPEHEQLLWREKSKYFIQDFASVEDCYTNRAAIFAEFGKIVCIGLGYFKKEDDGYNFIVKTITADNETELLTQFTQHLTQFQKKKRNLHLAGHNIKEFDVPFTCRRYLANGLMLPKLLQINHLKPWEVPFTDTLHLWRFGDFKHYTSLNLVAHTLGIASPKSNLDGSKVGFTFWEQNDIISIAEYCVQDVVTVAQVLLRLNHLPLLDSCQIINKN